MELLNMTIITYARHNHTNAVLCKIMWLIMTD